MLGSLKALDKNCKMYIMYCFMNKNNSIIQTVSQSLVKAMGADLTPEQRAEYEQSVQQLFLARLGVAIMEAMSPADQEAYQTQFVTTNTANSTEAQQFVNSKIPNLEAVMTKEAEDFIKEFTQDQ